MIGTLEGLTEGGGALDDDDGGVVAEVAAPAGAAAVDLGVVAPGAARRVAGSGDVRAAEALGVRDFAADWFVIPPKGRLTVSWSSR